MDDFRSTRTPASRPPAVVGRARRMLAGLGISAMVAATLAVVVPAAPSAAATVTRAQVMAAAASYAQSRGYRVGISVLDTRTGQLYGSASHTSTFASESVVKTFIATRLLVEGRMHGTTATRAYKMITQSDDTIASSLYGGVGGDSLINWIKAHYNIPSLGSPPRRANWWGNTHIVSDGLVRFYAKVKADRRVGPWLLNAMHHATHYGSDGQYQFFGLATASPGAAIKQGWGADYDDWSNSADFNTTGFVNGDRYAVAILARGSISHYGADISALLTGTARRLLPGGVFPSAAPVLSSSSPYSGPTRGGTRMTLHGAGFTGVRAVYFGRAKALAVRVVSSGTISLVTPAHPAGRSTVQVLTTHGNTLVSARHFNFIAPPSVSTVSPVQGPVTGGSRVTVRGLNFYHLTRVYFGSARSPLVHALSPTTLQAIVPAHATGLTNLRVVTWYGDSPVTTRDLYRFAAAPAVTAVAPSSGPPGGGTAVTISGTGFTPDAAVIFGAVPAGSVTYVSPTRLRALAPGHAVAPVNVRVRTAGGLSPINPSDYFSFVAAPPAPAPVLVPARSSGSASTATP